MDAAGFAAYASTMAVSAMSGVESAQEVALRKWVLSACTWKDKERKIVTSKRTVTASGGWLTITGRKGVKRVRTKACARILAARTLLSVPKRMMIAIPTRKEDLLAAVYVLHREEARTVGAECETAYNLLAGSAPAAK